MERDREQGGGAIAGLLGRLLRRRWQVLVFATEFVYMALELLASRLMSPYFGTTLDVWTAIIGVVLFASAVGNHLGGRVADTRRCRQWLSLSLLLLAAAFAVLPTLASAIGGRVPHPAGVAVTLASALAMFFVPSAAIGSVTPMAVALHGAGGEEGIGQTSSEVYVAMTLGGIAGTLATGFALVPAMGAVMLSHAMGVASLVLAVIVTAGWAGERGRRSRLAALALLTVPVSLAVALAARGVVGNSPDAAGGGVDVWIDTRYGRVNVYDATYAGRPVRVLHVDGGYESAMGLDGGDESSLVFDYTRRICEVTEARLGGTGRILALGGGAYSIPKHLAAASDGYVVDIVEIDPGVTDVARRWFGLADAEEAAGGRLRVIDGDARVFLSDDGGGDRYDIIINDTFAGEVPARTMATLEAARAAKGRLAEGGLYVSNVIGRLDSDSPSFLDWEVMTLRQAFRFVVVLPGNDHWEAAREDGASANWVVVATDDAEWARQALGSGESQEVTGVGTSVLTDDYSPVEWLAAQGRGA